MANATFLRGCASHEPDVRRRPRALPQWRQPARRSALPPVRPVSRFAHAQALLFQPGFLSREYFAGRRASCVTPLRLYLFASVLAFFAIHAGIETDERPAIPVTVGGAANADAAALTGACRG